jgi:hypothetical protein
MFREEIIKINIDKSIINSWTCFLADVWHDDIITIRQKLIANVQDRFIWNKDTEDYINEIVDRLGKYDNSNSEVSI